MFSVEKDIRGVDYTAPMIVNNAVDIAQEFEDVRAICRGYLGHLEDKNKKIDPEFIVFLYNLGMSEDEKKEVFRRFEVLLSFFCRVYGIFKARCRK